MTCAPCLVQNKSLLMHQTLYKQYKNDADTIPMKIDNSLSEFLQTSFFSYNSGKKIMDDIQNGHQN